MSNSPKDALKIDNNSAITNEGNNVTYKDKDIKKAGTIPNKEGKTKGDATGKQEHV